MYDQLMQCKQSGSKSETPELQDDNAPGFYISGIHKEISDILTNLKKKQIIPCKNYGTDDAPVYGVRGMDKGNYFMTREGSNHREIIVDITPYDPGAKVRCETSTAAAATFGSKENIVNMLAKEIAKNYGLAVEGLEYTTVFATKDAVHIENLEESICNVFNAQNDLTKIFLGQDKELIEKYLYVLNMYSAPGSYGQNPNRVLEPLSTKAEKISSF